MSARIALFYLAAFLVSGGAQAAAPADRTQSNTILVDQVIDAAVGDWNGDGLKDLAVLADSSDPDAEIGLYIYLRDPDSQMLKQAAAAPDRFWGRTHAGGMAGQEAAVSALSNGSIAIDTQNAGIGRSRWRSRISVALRNGRFLVAGYTHNEYDTLQQEKPLDCDLNLLSGKGTVNGKAVSFKPVSIRIEDWQEDAESNPGLRVCRNP